MKQKLGRTAFGAAVAIALALLLLSGCQIPIPVPPATPTPALMGDAAVAATAEITATVTATATLASPTVAPGFATTTTSATGTVTPAATFRASPTRRSPTPTPSATPRPSPARVHLDLTEAQLNKSVRDAIARDPNTPVRSIGIDTKPGKVVITAQARIGFFAVNLEITVVVDVRNGKATPAVQEIKVNGSPATGFLRQQVEAALQPYLNQIADVSKNMYVESVKITESGLSIDGRPK